VSEKVGIKESLEFLDLLELLGVEVASALKDGFQGDDLAKLVVNVVMAEEFQAGVKEIGKIPSEIKDIDASEGVQLGIRALQMVPKILDALKPEPV